MITNFESITADLNKDEMLQLSTVVETLKNIRIPTKASVIVDFLRVPMWLNGVKFTDVKLRKYANYIRSNGLLPLIATSDGYFVTSDTEKIEKQIKSLEQRANSIMKCADGMRKFI